MECAPSSNFNDLTPGQKGNEFVYRCPNTNTDVVITCNLDGKWEPGEPDCQCASSIGTSTTQSSTARSTSTTVTSASSSTSTTTTPPATENQTRTTSRTISQASSSTTNTTEEGGTNPGEGSEVNHFH